jgi:hypothetical protein
MKKRSMLAAGVFALASSLGVSGVIVASVAAPGNDPVVNRSQHSTHAQSGVQNDASSALVAGPAAPVGPPSGQRGPGGADRAPGQAASVAPLPDVASVDARPGNGKPKSLSEALAQPHGVAAVGAPSGNGKSLGEALAQPHGAAASGVTPDSAGVNNGTTKQAPGLGMRSLARGEQDAGVNDAARTGGCAPGYGDGRSCLPVAPPSAAQHTGHNVKVAWTCKELLTLFPQGIPLQIRGTDPLGLDEDGNGIACA